MRALALAAAVSTGCVSYWTHTDAPTYRTDRRCSTNYVPAVVDGGVAAIALTYAFVRINNMESGSEDNHIKAGALVLAAAVMTGSAIYGFRSASACERRQPHETLPLRPEPMVLAPRDTPLPIDTPLYEVVPARDPAAASYTRDAHREALEGSCRITRAAAAEVKAADPNYYVHVFLADEAIVRCLRATAGPAIP